MLGFESRIVHTLANHYTEYAIPASMKNNNVTFTSVNSVNLSARYLNIGENLFLTAIR